MARRAAVALAAAVFGQATAFGGEIPGLVPMLPPGLDVRYQFNQSNDFLGRGGSVDDFRTQQVILSAGLNERWHVVADHSVLTLSEPGSEGRIDQLSASLGYRWLDRQRGAVHDRVSVGGGIRSAGDFAGERMQNGFHRLVGSDVEFLPYSEFSETAVTGWIDAERYALFGNAEQKWRFGYWVRARALATSDGQVDGTLMTTGVVRRGFFEGWAGFRRDWRSGYEEPVQQATADAEDDLSAVIGVRFGTLVLETVQQFDNDASFGRLQLLSLESDADRAPARSRYGIELGFVLPDVHVRLAGRYRSPVPAPTGWDAALTAAVDIGEPQLGSNPSLYVETRQLSAGIEWQRRLSSDSNWVSGFVGIRLGYRDERVVGDGEQAGVRSDAVGRGVITADAGVRFHAATLGSNWRYQLTTGIAAWLPWSDATVVVGDNIETIQQPAIAITVGVSFDRR